MKKIFAGYGKCSSFGGTSDTGVTYKEGLALLEPPQVSDMRFRHLFQERMDSGLGLARNLSPFAHYCAMRWDYTVAGKRDLRNGIVKVTWSLDLPPVWCHPCDWGPALKTGRLIDMSPAAMRALGCTTDSFVHVEVYVP